MKRTFEIRKDITDDGKDIYDVYEQLCGDSEYIESFYDSNEAVDWVYDTYGRDIYIV